MRASFSDDHFIDATGREGELLEIDLKDTVHPDHSYREETRRAIRMEALRKIKAGNAKTQLPRPLGSAQSG